MRHRRTGKKRGDSVNNKSDLGLPRYFVEASPPEISNRSLAALVADRRCFAHQQEDEDKLVSSTTDPQPYVDTISKHCAEAWDYLPPDTPLKEAIFRVILAGGNEPITPKEVSQILAEKWVMSPYPRDVSPQVIQRLLEHSQYYLIAKLPEPVIEERPAVLKAKRARKTPEDDPSEKHGAKAQASEGISEEPTP